VSKRRSLKKKAPPPVSSGGICVESSLPLPIVHYPNHYGAFFAFSKEEGEDFYLCECGRLSLENLIELNRRLPQQTNTNPLRHAGADSFHVPNIVARKSLSHESSGLDAFEFRQGICHRCNLIPPSQRWCHEMYGGQFKQSFGWYIQQAYLRLGIHPLSYEYLADRCPAEFRLQIDEMYSRHAEYHNNSQAQENLGFGDLAKEMRKIKRKLNNDVGNIVRQEFGFKKVGEGWVSETLLYQAICRLLPNEQIIRHLRPDWLEGLELDIYVPRLNLGLEYQGQQHYKPVSAWGGERALLALQERDDRKRKICRAAGTVLVEVDFTEAITEQHIRGRLLQVGVSLE
jgi:hypothetical protein